MCLIMVNALFIVAITISSATNDLAKRDRLSRWLWAFHLGATAWFLAVESAVVEENCAACLHGRTVLEYRFGPLVLHRDVRRDFPTIIEWVAADLGVPCSHVSPERWDNWRLKGLCLRNDHGSIAHLSDRPWYPACARNAVRSWRQEPNFAQTFRQRVLVQHDIPYWRSLMTRLREV